jgi:hypothetical protein
MAKSVVTMRSAIGWIPRTKTPIRMTAVLVNGKTISQFSDATSAIKFAEEHYPLSEYVHEYSIQKVG